MSPVTGKPIDRRDGRLKVTGRANMPPSSPSPTSPTPSSSQSTISQGRDRRL